MRHENETKRAEAIPKPPFKRMGGMIHIIIWGILIASPFFLTIIGASPIAMEHSLRLMAMIVSFMVVFYVNYFVLVKRFLYTRRLISFVFANLLLIIGVMLFTHLLGRFLPHPFEDTERFIEQPIRLELIFFFLGNVLLYSLIIGLSVAIRMTGSWYEIEAARKELERSRAEAELQNLKSQLNPHFLFNTLNNIYSLVAISPEQAQEAVHGLSHLLRYVLYESSELKVPLSKELEFVHNYIELMRIRLPEHVGLTTGIIVKDPERQIAPLLFITLIENAFKHGVSNNKASFIHIRIIQQDETLLCDIKNSSFPKDSRDESGSGIGVLNLEKRLALIYPGKYEFKYGLSEGAYEATLSIHF